MPEYDTKKSIIANIFIKNFKFVSQCIPLNDNIYKTFKKKQYHSVTSNSTFKGNCPSGRTLLGQIIINVPKVDTETYQGFLSS